MSIRNRVPRKEVEDSVVVIQFMGSTKFRKDGEEGRVQRLTKKTKEEGEGSRVH